MKYPEPRAWKLPSKVAFASLRRELQRSFGMRHVPGKVRKIEVLDNFDWSLWHNNVSFVKTGPQTYLMTVDNREIEVVALTSPPRFWLDFPPGECQDYLKKYSPLRALQSITTIRFTVHQYELLNDDEKIVVRLRVIQHYSAESHQSRKIIGIYLQAIPLLGYEDEFQRVVEAVVAEQLEATALPNVAQLCICQGLEVKPKPGKSFGIHAAMMAEDAARHMGGALLSAALEQRAGLLADTDTEFLHQYRVNLRKLRSLLSLLKKALNPAEGRHLQNLLSQVFSPTNDLRDLDVFLLQYPQYQQVLPNEFKAGLNTFYQHLANKRQQRQKQVVRALRSKTYCNTIENIEKRISQAADYSGELAKQPIGELARKRILSRYRKICQIGARIQSSTPDTEIHELRKECKKLRYLMEFFAELFPRQRMSKLIKQLKGLQDVLGNFNDFSVQKTFLQTMAKQEQSKPVLAAVSGLIAIISQQQAAVRQHIQAAFVAFSDHKTTRMLKSLTVQA